MKIKLSTLFRSDWLHSALLRKLVPGQAKALLKRRIPYADFRVEQLRREAEQFLGGQIPVESEYESPNAAIIGIFFDNSYTFALNVAACRELRVRFKVIDLLASDWVRRVVDSDCDAFLATPPTLRGIWHRVYEERLRVVTHDLKKRLCPAFDELYLWESKRRMRDWLQAHDIPHPETWVFFDRVEAMDFCRNTDYPVICKTNRGATSSGVFILRDRRAAERLVNRAFGRGLLGRSVDPREREQGTVLFQRYVPHNYEWRIVRIGAKFMCRRKVRKGLYASGSGDIGWAAPLPGMLDFARRVTESGGFRHMAVDMFSIPGEDGEASYLVNELQAIVGFRDVPENENTGYWYQDKIPSLWAFENGSYHQNECANLRVQMLLDDI